MPPPCPSGKRCQPAAKAKAHAGLHGARACRVGKQASAPAGHRTGRQASRGEAVVDPPVERGAASGTGGGRGLVSLSPAVRRCHTMAGRVARVKISLAPLLPSSRAWDRCCKKGDSFQFSRREANIMSPQSGRKIQHVCPDTPRRIPGRPTGPRVGPHLRVCSRASACHTIGLHGLTQAVLQTGCCRGALDALPPIGSVAATARGAPRGRSRATVPRPRVHVPPAAWCGVRRRAAAALAGRGANRKTGCPRGGHTSTSHVTVDSASEPAAIVEQGRPRRPRSRATLLPHGSATPTAQQAPPRNHTPHGRDGRCQGQDL